MLQQPQDPGLQKALRLVSGLSRGVWCWRRAAWGCSYLSSPGCVAVSVSHNFPAFVYVGMEPR